VYSINPDGSRRAHHYSEISCAIAAGLLIAAIQNAGLCTLTSTPLNADLPLKQLLERPENEKVALLLPIGYPGPNATVPNMARKQLEEIMVVVK